MADVRRNFFMIISLGSNLKTCARRKDAVQDPMAVDAVDASYTVTDASLKFVTVPDLKELLGKIGAEDYSGLLRPALVKRIVAMAAACSTTADTVRGYAATKDKRSSKASATLSNVLSGQPDAQTLSDAIDVAVEVPRVDAAVLAAAKSKLGELRHEAKVSAADALQALTVDGSDRQALYDAFMVCAVSILPPLAPPSLAKKARRGRARRVEPSPL